MEKFFTRVCGCVVAAVLMVAMSAQAFATSKTVTVTEAGTLSTLIPASEKNAITSLTVSGTLNGTDIRFIREMAGLDIEGETTDGKLTELNIAGIELTDGGDAYYEDAWSKYYTATSYDVSEDNDLYYCTDLSYAFTGTNLTKVVWPATMWEVGENALAYCSDLKEFVLGSETNEIKPHAFSRCSALETITLTPKIIYIDEFAFSDCSSLKSIALPAGLEMLDKSCFLGCSSLASVTFGNVTEIREKVFYGCKALTNVVLPATLTKLDKAVFDGCSSLTEITLPKKLKTLGEAVFEGCTALKAINVAEGNASFASADGVLFNKAKTNLLAFPAGKTGAYAVPSGTEEIAAPITITADVFEDVDLNTCVLNVPEEGVEAYKADAQWGKFKNINGIMPSGVNDVVSSIDASVSVANGVLTIDGAQGDISVYNIGGVRLANGSERLSVTLSKGVYIVTLNGKATKVIVK